MKITHRKLVSANVEAFGLALLRYGLVLILFWIGAMKFTAFEAEGIKPLIASSPLMSWLYRIFDPQRIASFRMRQASKAQQAGLSNSD